MKKKKTDFTSAGFMSETVADSVAVFAVHFPIWVSLSREVNEVACKILASLRPKRAPREVLAVAVFYRVLTAYQSAYLLIERGNDVDCKAMLRNEMEALFVLRAVQREAGFAEKFIRADEHGRLKKLRKYVEVEEEHGSNPFMTADEMKNVRAEIASLEAAQKGANWVKVEEVKIERIAKVADLEILYKQVYPYLCSFTHGSPSGLADYVRVSAKEIQFVRGQQDQDAEGNLRMGIFLLISAMESIKALFSIAVGAKWKALAKKYVKAIKSSETQTFGHFKDMTF